MLGHRAGGWLRHSSVLGDIVKPFTQIDILGLGVYGPLSQRLCPKQPLHFEGEMVLSAVPLVSNLEHDLYKTGAIIARTDMMVAYVTDHPMYSDCRSGPRIPWHM